MVYYEFFLCLMHVQRTFCIVNTDVFFLLNKVVYVYFSPLQIFNQKMKIITLGKT